MTDKLYSSERIVEDERSCPICCGGCSSAFLKNASAPFVPSELKKLKTPVFEQSLHGGCCDVDDTVSLPIGCPAAETPPIDDRPWGAEHPVDYNHEIPTLQKVSEIPKNDFESKKSSELSLSELDDRFFENTKFIFKHTNSGTVMLWVSILAMQYILLSRLAHLFGGQLSSDSKMMQKIEGKYAEISNPDSPIRRHSHEPKMPVYPGERPRVVKEPENVKAERSVYFPKEHYEPREMGMFPWLLGVTAIAGGAVWLTPDEFKNKIWNGETVVQKYVLDYFKEPKDESAFGAGGGHAPTFTGTGVETSSGQVAKQYFGSDRTQTHILEGFRFASGQSSIDNPPMETVDVLGMLYNSGECSGYQLHGYTDSVGSEASNNELSVARASFIQSVLVENSDMFLGSVEVFGHGEKNPLWSNDTVEGRAENRRVEIICNPS